MMESAGLARVDVRNLSAGIVAIHRGYRIYSRPRAERVLGHRRRSAVPRLRDATELMAFPTCAVD